MAGYSAPQRQIPLPGLASRNSIERTTAQAVTMCGYSYTCEKAMVGWTGASKDAPGSLLTGYANLVQLTTLLRLASLGGDFKAIN